jgi:hypothetical protein
MTLTVMRSSSRSCDSSRSGACFIAGTPVWTDRGQVPIEQLKVGDNVLSQPDGTGERAYRKVARTFSHTDQTISCLRYCLPPPDDKVVLDLYTTDGHPFWVKGAGWTSANLLEGGEELELQDGRAAYVLSVVFVFKADRPYEGWVPTYLDSVDGFEIDFSDGKQWWLDDRDQRNFGASLGRLLTTVYDIEIEDFDTYYVGELGVWVHKG